MPMTSVIHAQSDHSGDSKNNHSSAQSPILAQYFNQTRPICDFESLQGLSVWMEDGEAYQAHEWPSCNGVTLHAPHWISFVAGSDELSLEIEVTDCLKENGVQLAVYQLPADIPYGKNQIGLQPSTSMIGSSVTGCFYAKNPQKGSIKFTTKTTPGEMFGLLVDGWNGDQCQLKFKVLKGETLSSLPQDIEGYLEFSSGSTEMQGDTICTGSQEVPFELHADVKQAQVYIWTVNGTTLPPAQTEGKRALIDFHEEGVHSVCVMATNHCDTTNSFCIDVPVKTIKQHFEGDTICQGETFGWWKGNELLNTYGPFETFIGDTSLYHTFTKDGEECKKEWRMPLNVKNVNEEAPIKIDTFARFDELPILLLDTMLDRPVNDLIISTNEKEDAVACRKYYDLNLYVLGGKFSTNVTCNGDNLDFSFSGVDDSIFYSPWVEQFKYLDRNLDLDYVVKWRLNGENLPTYGSKVSVSKDDLLNYADNDSLFIEQNLTVLYRGTKWLSIDAPTIKISIAEYFPTLETDIQQIGDSLIIKGQEFDDYQWVNCETQSTIENETHSYFIPSERGEYSVMINNGDCYSLSDCVEFFPTINSLSEGFKIFPNPANDYISIKADENFSWPARITIFSSTAQQLINRMYSPGEQINLSSLPKGVYVIEIEGRTESFIKSE